MDRLNLSSYIKILRPGLKEHDGQESAALFLLNSINDQKYVAEHGYHTDNLSSKKISRLMNQIDSVPDGIKHASMVELVINEVIAYFQDKVIADFNPHLKDDTIDTLLRLIEVDGTIPKNKKNTLMKYHEDGDDALFLAETFLYALNRPNKDSNDSVSYKDIPLLAEANYECPLCQRKLVETIKGQPIKRYRITQIFPSTLDEATASKFNAALPSSAKGETLDNLIALDRECSERF